MNNKTQFKVNDMVRYDRDYVLRNSHSKEMFDFIQTDPIGRINSIKGDRISVQWCVTNPPRVTIQPKEWLGFAVFADPSGRSFFFDELRHYLTNNNNKTMNNKNKQVVFKINDKVRYIPTLQKGYITFIDLDENNNVVYTIFSKPENQGGEQIAIDVLQDSITCITRNNDVKNGKRDNKIKSPSQTYTESKQKYHGSLVESENVDTKPFTHKLKDGDILKFPSFLQMSTYARVLGRNGNSIFLSKFTHNIVELASSFDLNAIYTVQELKEAGAILMELDNGTHTSPSVTTSQETQDMIIYSAMLATKPAYITAHAFKNQDDVIKGYQGGKEQAPKPEDDKKDNPTEETQIIKNKLISFLVDRVIYNVNNKNIHITEFMLIVDELYLLAEVFGIKKEVVSGVQEKGIAAFKTRIAK